MPNLFLGDARAEQDYVKLKSTFYESPDYRTLIESEVKSIVVGRRGVGKSALFLRLKDYYLGADKVEVITFAPDDYEILAFRPISKRFGDKFNLVRAATRQAFRYAILLEVGAVLSTRFKFSQCADAPIITRHLSSWKSQDRVLSKLKRLIEKSIEGVVDPEDAIGALVGRLGVSELEAAVDSVLATLKRQVVVLVDRLDEGYEPDSPGVAIVDGFLNGAVDLKDHVPSIRCIIFLRDNIYRAVERKDDDFSRNLEQAVLRLHWDERNLLNFVVLRIREALGSKAEKSIRVWDSVTRGSLQGEAGFHQCLRLTLFRPRDLLLLLNESFRQSSSRDLQTIDQDDINSSALSISQHRLQDVEKEYAAHIPGLGRLVQSFAHGSPSMTVAVAAEIIAKVLRDRPEDPAEAQQYELFNDPVDAIRAFYSIGFLGIREEGAHNYVFSHDGRQPDRDFGVKVQIMIHPCYWMALNLSPEDADEKATSEIYDEYDVTVVSETPEHRSRQIGRLESELRGIETGVEGATAFEKWCLKAIKVLFAGGLRNIELNANKSNLQRRDVVARNQATTPFWKRVLADYETRQVVFEIKNFSELGREEFRQVASYLSRDYGRIAFVVTRTEDVNIRRDRELAWIRELRNDHNKVVVIVPAKFLVAQLNKVRSPAKHDAGDEAMAKLLDQYVRTYFGESAPIRKKDKK